MAAKKAGGGKAKPAVQNTKVTSENVSALAAKVLKDPRASKIQRSLAASALSQRDASKQTGSKAEDMAAMVMKGKRYAKTTRTLAASVLAQAVKER